MMICKEYSLNNQLDWEKLIEKSETASFFQTKEWLTIWFNHFPVKSIILAVYDNNDLIGLAPFSIIKKTINVLGVTPVLAGELVSDYGDIISLTGREKEIWQSIINYLKNHYPEFDLVLNFFREDSESFNILRPLTKKIGEVDVAPYLDLEKNWEDYLGKLERKYRHELRRKIRRLEEVDYRFYQGNINRDNKNEFLRLMRLSSPAKNKFLSEKMVKFFDDLMSGLNKKEIALWFLEIDKKKVAGLLTFRFKDEILLYNSGFNPAYAKYSAGLLATAYLIKEIIGQGLKRLDFLRGNERFKHDLGGHDKKLYQLTIKL